MNYYMHKSKRLLHTSWLTTQVGVAAFTQSDRLKSVRYRCVIEHFDGVLCCHFVVLFYVGMGAFVI